MRQLPKGFTMVELIVVIIILGILAAVALPRFTNLQRDARVAKLNAARGAVASAAAQVHGSAVARQGQVQPPCPIDGTVPNITGSTGNGTICTESGIVNVFALYPYPSLPGIIAAAGLAQGTGVPTASDLTAEGYSFLSNGTVLTITVPGGTAEANCSFTYTAAASLGATAIVGPTTTTGC